MLRNQYGVATPSSATPVSHAEDAQPNETIYKRRHGHPPQIGSIWKDNYQDSRIQRSGCSGWTQYGRRGKSSSRRGRGNFKSNRGGHNSNQRYTDQAQGSTRHSVPPIATLPDAEYRLSSSNFPSSSQIKPNHQPHSPAIILPDRLPQTEPHYKAPPTVPTFSPPTFSDRQPVDDHRWLHRSRSPSPKFPQSALKRRTFECQPRHVSNSGRNEDSVSQSVKHHSLTADIMPPKTNKPPLPGRHRQSEGSSSIRALHSPEPLVQVQTETISPAIPAGTSTIKQEARTPSPAHSLRTERSLITSSCKFYPIPELCKKLYPNFKENRKAFFKEKMQELTRLRLTKIRSFFRDDGLVIEWKSNAPVWSDTLLPEFPDLASAIKRAHQMNHQTSIPKRKRQSVEQHSRQSSLKNDNMELDGSKRPRHFLEKDGAGETETVESSTMSFRNTSSPKPTSSFDHGNRPSTTVVPLLNISELIPLDDAEVVLHNQYDTLGDTKPHDTSVVQEQNRPTAMDVDTPTQTLKPVRRMLFKPVLPHRRNQPMTSSIQDSTSPTSDSVEPSSTRLSAAEGHSKDEMEVIPQPQDDVPVQEKTTSPRPHLPLSGPTQSHPSPIPQPSLIVTQKTSTQGLSKSCTPTLPSLPPPRCQVAEEVESRATLPKDEDYVNATDPDAELVVDLLLLGTPEEPHDHLSNPLQEEIMQLHTSHEGQEGKKDRDDGPSVADENTLAVEGLATRFLQGYLQLFDVDRLKLEAAYAKNALFSCRVHHVQEPSFSMAELFAPESSKSRQGFNVSLACASISAIQQGRSQIVNRLLELGPHRFCPRGVPRTVNYNVVPLSSDTCDGCILLTVHGEVVNPHLAGPHMDHVLSVDQSFVLRKRELKDEDEEKGMDGFGQTISNTAASILWPLVAVSHQMIVRDVAPLTFEQSDDLASHSRR